MYSMLWVDFLPCITIMPSIKEALVLRTRAFGCAASLQIRKQINLRYNLERVVPFAYASLSAVYTSLLLEE